LVFRKLQQPTDINAVEANPALSNKRDAIMIRLLDECIRMLSEQGILRLFVDAIRGGDERFQSTGQEPLLFLPLRSLSADVGLQASKNGRDTKTYGEKLDFVYVRWMVSTAELAVDLD
jgi:hypothetical protein